MKVFQMIITHYQLYFIKWASTLDTLD